MTYFQRFRGHSMGPKKSKRAQSGLISLVCASQRAQYHFWQNACTPLPAPAEASHGVIPEARGSGGAAPQMMWERDTGPWGCGATRVFSLRRTSRPHDSVFLRPGHAGAWNRAAAADLPVPIGEVISTSFGKIPHHFDVILAQLMAQDHGFLGTTEGQRQPHCRAQPPLCRALAPTWIKA